ncbi:MAG: methyltransferase domain-containing protein [Deltaproteobacteria bacterium]|nr:methyltransferase domain-containing protein [Deltaproteobacteria bacterium]
MRWGEQLQLREIVHQQYPKLWSLKVVRKRLPFILKYLEDGEAVLEIGAFNRELGERIKKHRPRIQYKSMDIDPTYSHDYASLEEIKETFDMILLFEVIEHLSREKGKGLVNKICEILKPGGKVILTTPNVYTPGQYWKDVSHETPYHYEELGGLFLSEGFESIEMYRLFSEPFLKYFFRVWLCSPFFQFLGIDFTKSILLMARKG